MNNNTDKNLEELVQAERNKTNRKYYKDHHKKINKVHSKLMKMVKLGHKYHNKLQK
jgi:hypothetical protein